jgi:hypothetical protein
VITLDQVSKGCFVAAAQGGHDRRVVGPGQHAN